MPSKDTGAKRGTKRKLAADLRSSPAQEGGVEVDVSVCAMHHAAVSCLNFYPRLLALLSRDSVAQPAYCSLQHNCSALGSSLM